MTKSAQLVGCTDLACTVWLRHGRDVLFHVAGRATDVLSDVTCSCCCSSSCVTSRLRARSNSYLKKWWAKEVLSIKLSIVGLLSVIRTLNIKCSVQPTYISQIIHRFYNSFISDHTIIVAAVAVVSYCLRRTQGRKENGLVKTKIRTLLGTSSGSSGREKQTGKRERASER